jgi:hypothetical protein
MAGQPPRPLCVLGSEFLTCEQATCSFGVRDICDLKKGLSL